MEVVQSFTNKQKRTWRRGSWDRYINPYYHRDRYLANRTEILKKKREKYGVNKTKREKNLIPTLNFLKYTINRRSFIPALPKKKHPFIKDWNKEHYLYNKRIDLNNLPRGCLKIRKDTYKKHTIVGADIDEKRDGTKISRKYGCSYITSPKGHIKIGFLVEEVAHKTGKLYFNGEAIGDFKCTGEVMLPNNDYGNSKGEYLGFYEFVHGGTFFANRNRVSSDTGKVCEQLERDWGLKYVSISEHMKIQKQMLAYTQAQIVQLNR